MYPESFGLKAPGFSITPDPHYLYLSKRHQEALAHLLYGAEHDGFVLLTGEVGTGKTTICRAFLQQLPPQVNVALILNPAVSAIELLQGISKEFQISLPPGEITIQILNEHLNDYLLTAHAQGRRPVLLIDEAQGLRPEVLEQVRLLTNLETETNKLLQIFLVGQPELRELLSQEQLRQVSQRITARFHLTPLNAQETAIYIRHRLTIAGATRRIFTRGAMRQIYKITKGIPRLINILCDRALLGAYATHKNTVNSRLIIHAARELQGNTSNPPNKSWLMVLGVLAMLIFTTNLQIELQVTPPLIKPFVGPPLPPLIAKPTLIPPLSLPIETFLMPRQIAMQLLLQNWQVPLMQNTAIEPCVMAQQVGLYCRSSTESWEGLQRYNYPAVLKLNSQQEPTKYALVLGLDQNQVLLASANQQTWFSRHALQALWSGTFIILWHPPLGGHFVINRYSSNGAVQWLRETLKQAMNDQTLTTFNQNRFDTQLETALRTFQSQHGLQADGIAGPETLICLSNAANLPNLPKLQQP